MLRFKNILNGMQRSRLRACVPHAAGFTLIEMALVLVVLGLFVGAILSFAETDDAQKAFSETQYRQQKVAIAISDFANRHGYVPCAASVAADLEDFGYEPDLADCASMSNGISLGIIPFKTLALPIEFAYDGYGNLMEYLVFPTAYRAQDTSVTVHSNCRIRNYALMPPEYQWIHGGVNINAPKARFCCPQYVAGMWLDGPDGLPLVPGQSNGAFIIPPSSFRAVNIANDTPPDPNVSLSYIAYKITSYGKNGSFAPIHRGPGQCGTYPANYSTAGCRVPTHGSQQASTFDNPGGNSNTWIDSVFRRVHPINLIPGTNYYDNIHLWRTQEQVISETGMTDCFRP